MCGCRASATAPNPGAAASGSMAATAAGMTTATAASRGRRTALFAFAVSRSSGERHCCEPCSQAQDEGQSSRKSCHIHPPRPPELHPINERAQGSDPAGDQADVIE